MSENPIYRPSGDTGILIKLGKGISPITNRKVRELAHAIESKNLPYVEEIIPTYDSLLVIYSPLLVPFNKLISELKEIEEDSKKSVFPPDEVVHIPTFYGGEYGIDINDVAEHAKLSVEEVVKHHSYPNYLIYMLGFTPGFPYLGGMDERLSTPRLEVPRTKIPAGSVGIAGNQTGIYPIDSPGGWRIIGRTPLRLFDPSRENSILLKAGQYLKFYAIDSDEFKEISLQVEKGVYQVKKTSLKGCDNLE